jgi:VWFA-related protein
MRVGILGTLLVTLGAGLMLAQGQGAAPQTPPVEQPPTPGQPTFRTGIGLVRVDVTVSGGDDRPIADLTAADFDVREDGVPQTVETLQFVRLTGRREAGDDTALDIRSPEHAAAEAARDDVRLLVIFLDDYHLRYGPLYDYRLRRMLHGFVDAEMKETDLFAVMDPLTPIDFLNLTRAKQDMFDRIEKLQGRMGGFVPPRSVLEESHYSLRGPDRMRIRAEITLSALESLVNYLGALREGRKSVLFISEGPPLMVDGAEMTSRLREVVTAANRSNVTIHTLDPRELGLHRMSNGSNEALSYDTGGRRLAHSNDYSKGLRAVMADASAYYLLGYAPKRPNADGKFHEIDVKVRRKGVRVLARKGYWAPTPEEMRPRTPTPTAPADVTTALGRLTPPPAARAIDWWLGYERDAGGGTRATFTWEPLERALQATRPAPERVVVSIGDTTPPEEHPAVATPQDAAARGPWQVSFTVLPGKQKLRVRALSHDGGTVDEWSEDVVVPDLAGDALAMATLRVYRASTAAAWRAVTNGPGEIAPIASRRLRRTDRVLVTIPLSAGAADAELSAELLTKQGKRLVALPVSRASDAGAPARLELPVANLAQAEYVLRVAADRAGGSVGTQALAFIVVP